MSAHHSLSGDPIPKKWTVVLYLRCDVDIAKLDQTTRVVFTCHTPDNLAQLCDEMVEAAGYGAIDYCEWIAHERNENPADD